MSLQIPIVFLLVSAVVSVVVFVPFVDISRLGGIFFTIPTFTTNLDLYE